MKIRKNCLDTKINIDNNVYVLRFLDKNLYPLLIKRGFGYVFEKEKKKLKDDKTKPDSI